MFVAAGDKRSALYARLGRIRATAEEGRLPVISAQLAGELEKNPLLQTDKRLRMFCLIVKGDIDGEFNSVAMRHDWEQVQALARDLGDAKWQYRALAQLGLAAFYEGDLETARKNVGTALGAATKAGDAGAQIRYLTVLGIGLMQSKMYEQALPYFDNALKIAAATPGAGYSFVTAQSRLEALVGMNQLDAAQGLADDILARAKQKHALEEQATVLVMRSKIARARKDEATELASLEQAVSLSRAAGAIPQLANEQSLLANVYREQGNLPEAEHFAALAAESTQASGDIWSVPQRLQTLAEIKISRDEFAEADRLFDRAGAFVDSMEGSFSGVLDKAALIKSSSDLYSEHFALIAKHFNNPSKAFSIVEQVRGRINSDLLMAGSVAPGKARDTEQVISKLQLKLADARSTAEVHSIRDQIFMAEQSRWVTPGLNILKARGHSTIGLDRVEESLSPSSVILEYVVADPNSYCLVISRSGSDIVSLAGKEQIDGTITDYSKAVKSKGPAREEGRRLYDVLLRPIPEASQKETLVIIRDARLHLVPFEGFVDESGRYVVETHTVIYEPSATSFYLLEQDRRRPHAFRHDLLGVGGVPYDPNQLKKASLTRGYDANELSNLPASKDEVLAAEAAIHDPKDTLLLGSSATESAFKRSDLAEYRIIHLAVHGFADTTDPDDSALVLLPGGAEDGYLRASEIVQLHLNADLVILSACDTAIGPIQGEEGIAALSRAFLLAGAKAVVSTLWSIEDAYSLVVMSHFYQHLAAQEPGAKALTEAKRDTLREFGPAATPYHWAGFIFEGGVDRATLFHDDEQKLHHIAQSAGTRQDPSVH
jgi:CHAT domain-containing protein